jgi:lipoprotein-releasing system permease protein
VRQPYQFSIALRYLRSHGKNSFISFISIVSMIGIAIAVAVLITVLSVTNGFEHELEQRILGLVSHATLSGYEGPLDDWRYARERALERPDIRGAAPVVQGEGMVFANEEIFGVSLSGIDPALEREVSGLDEAMVAGDLDSLEPRAFRMLIGRDLAEALGVEVGGTLLLALPQANVTPVGILPRMKRFTVSGIFDSGIYEFDRGMVFVHFDDASVLYRTGGRATGLRLAVTDMYQAGRIVRELAIELGRGFNISDWSRRHQPFFRSIQLSKGILTVILSLVVCVAAFNIVSTLVMVVSEKRGDIGILRSIGASPRSILGVFASQGSLIGILGTAFGALLGITMTLRLTSAVRLLESWLGTELFSGEVYVLSELPTQIRSTEVIGICIFAFVLALLATIYPAMSAARQPPAEALRHE